MARILCVLFLLITTAARTGIAEQMPRFAAGYGPEIRKITGVQIYRSGSGRYELVMNVPEGTWSLKKDGHALWRKHLPNQPGAAAVSDDGERITQPIWQFVDEINSYCSGIVFYDRNGEPGSSIHFLDGWRNLLLSADHFALSPDGTMIVVVSHGKQRSELVMIDGENGRKRWGVHAGFGTVDEICMTTAGAYTLSATHEGCDMEFILFDRDGKQVWSRKMVGNFSPAVNSYIRFDKNEKGFLVYNLSSLKFQRIMIPVQQVNEPKP